MCDDYTVHVARSYTSSPDNPFSLILSYGGINSYVDDGLVPPLLAIYGLLLHFSPTFM